MAKTYLTPQQLCDAIYSAVFNAGYPVSRLDICRIIERKKSPHILAMIDYLVENRFLKAEMSLSKQGMGMFLYTVGEEEPQCSENTPG